MKTPVDHILRPPLPWRQRDDGITECGYAAGAVSTITRDQWIQRVKDIGRQRSAMITCMTCSGAAERWVQSGHDLRKTLGREIEWECGSSYWQQHKERDHRLLDELEAIAALIETHREEFDAHIAASKQRREWIEKKVDHLRKRQPKPKYGGIL